MQVRRINSQGDSENRTEAICDLIIVVRGVKRAKFMWEFQLNLVITAWARGKIVNVWGD
jgi:hypothetical protein